MCPLHPHSAAAPCSLSVQAMSELQNWPHLKWMFKHLESLNTRAKVVAGSPPCYWWKAESQGLVDRFLVHQWLLRKLQKAEVRAFRWKQAWFGLCALSWRNVTRHHYFSWASLIPLSPRDTRSLGAPKGWVQIIHLDSTFYTTETHNFIWILLAFLWGLEDATIAK